MFEIEILKLLFKWRKNKSQELAELICNKLLYQNGKFNDEDVDLIETEINDLEKEKRELLYGS